VAENQRGGRLGRACGAQAWTDEMNGTRGRKFSVGERRLYFKGSGREGCYSFASRLLVTPYCKGKTQFPSMEDQNFEFHSKGNLD
jgi:hypothetical protein